MQMEEINPRLKEFIIDYCTKYKIGSPDQGTLDLVDIEIELFVAEFAEQFHVDQSKFSWYKYGYPTGSASVNLIKAVFGYKSNWVKRLSRRIYKPKFRVSILQEAVKTGKLV